MSIVANDLMKVAARLSVNRNQEHQPFMGMLLPTSRIVDFPCSSLAVPCMLAGPSQHPRFYPSSKIDELRLSRWMSQPVAFKNDDVNHVPKVILERWVSTFRDIVEQRRFRLVQNSRRFVDSSQDQFLAADSRIATLEVLSNPSIFKFSEGVTTCRPLPPSRKTVEHENTCNGTVKLAIVFSLKITVTIMKMQKVIIVINAPGTLEGTLTHGNIDRLDHADLHLDTDALCKAMRERTTYLVERADAIASKYQRRAPKTVESPSLVVKTTKCTGAASVALLPPEEGESHLCNLKPSVRSARCA